MALTKVRTGGIAADAVDNTILKLDDDFALTGTVTGAGVSTATSTLPSEGGAATTIVAQGLAKCWVHFDAENQTLAVDDSLNVASVTDSATGKYIIVIANDMANATYSLTTAAMMGQTSGGGNDDGRVVGFNRAVTPTAAACALMVTDINNAANVSDSDEVCCTIHGDLA
tara:strand:+ start:63 stop:572 length:510 start_codon:yes stop_codon:yes gene_type:complete